MSALAKPSPTAAESVVETILDPVVSTSHLIISSFFQVHCAPRPTPPMGVRLRPWCPKELHGTAAPCYTSTAVPTPQHTLPLFLRPDDGACALSPDKVRQKAIFERGRLNC